MSIRLILEEGSKVQDFEFPDDSVSIGRTADNMIRISSKTSSRQHCRVTKTGEGFFVEDLKSRNGTQVNGEEIKKRLLTIGDRIEIGTSILHFQERLDGGTRAAAPVASKSSDRRPAARSDRTRAARPRSDSATRRKRKPAAEAASPSFAFEFLNPPGKGPVALEGFPFMIGSRETNGLTINGAEVAPEHCMIVPANEGLFLVDLGSPAGTILNGSKVTREALSAGAVVKLGEVTLRVVESHGKPQKPARPSAKAVVDEVDDFDALGEDDEEEAPKPRSDRQRAAPKTDRQRKVPKTDRQRKIPKTGQHKQVARSEKPAPAPASNAELETDDLGAQLARIDTGRAEAATPGWLAALQSLIALVALGAVLVVSVLILKGVLQQEEADPAPEGLLTTNWSFEAEAEPGAEGAIPGWTMSGEQADFSLTEAALYGQRSLLVALPAGANAQVAAAARRNLGVDGLPLRARGAVSIEGQAIAALKLAWTDESGASLGQSLVALSNESGERLLTGEVPPPPRASGVQLVVEVLALGGAKVRLDRLELQEVQQDPALFELSREDGALLVDARGVASVYRQGASALDEVIRGLEAGLPNEGGFAIARFGRQSAGRPEGEPRSRKRSLRARIALLDAASSSWRRLSTDFSATGQGFAMRYAFEAEGLAADKPLVLHLEVPNLARIKPITVVDANGAGETLETLFGRQDGSASIRIPAIREVIFGEGGEQLSMQLLALSDLVARKSGKGLVLDALMPPQRSEDELVIGVDVSSSSTLIQARIRELFRSAQEARDAEDLSGALEIYRTIARRYAFDERARDMATSRSREIEETSRRLFDQIKQASDDADDVAASSVLPLAEQRLEALVKAFPEASNTARAKELVEGIRKRAEQRAREDRAREAADLLAQARRLREQQRDALARAVLERLVTDFDEELQSVKDGRIILERLGGR